MIAMCTDDSTTDPIKLPCVSATGFSFAHIVNVHILPVLVSLFCLSLLMVVITKFVMSSMIAIIRMVLGCSSCGCRRRRRRHRRRRRRRCCCCWLRRLIIIVINLVLGMIC